MASKFDIDRSCQKFPKIKKATLPIAVFHGTAGPANV
jgi:hypothetical protein